MILRTTGKRYAGQPVVIECDGDCAHAWGISWWREKGETAPEFTGTSGGPDVKPLPPYPPKEHNRWCVRECERSKMKRAG